MVSNVEWSTSPEMIHLDLVLVGDFLVFSHGKSTRSGESRGFLIDPAPWHTSGAFALALLAARPLVEQMVKSGYKTELTVPMLEKADRVVMSGGWTWIPCGKMLG